jgi:hypothetical protein
MSEIDRYIICVPSHINDFKNIEKVSYGGLVLYTDHLAKMAELANVCYGCPEVAEKNARIKGLTEALKKIAKMGEAKEMRHPLVDDGFEPINPILKVRLEMAAKIATAALTAQKEGV